MYLSQLKAKLAYVRKVSWKSTSYRISSLIFLASSLFTIKFIISLFINTRLTHYPSRIIRINSECVNIRIYFLYSRLNKTIILWYRVGKVLRIEYMCIIYIPIHIYIYTGRGIRWLERKFKTPRSILMNHDWNRVEIYITRSEGIRASDITL